MPHINDSQKPVWHGVLRKEINWHPRVEDELCIGCGLCVLGCVARIQP